MKKLLLFILILFSIKSLAQVGIGVSLPLEMLDIDGNLKLRNINTLQSNEKYHTLVVDETGVIKKIKENSDNSYSFNNVKFIIKNVEQDYLQELNTLIPTKDYIVIITGFQFDIVNKAGLISSIDRTKYFHPTNISAKEVSGTWRLSADYPMSGTAGSTNGTWTINTVIINRHLVQSLNVITTNLNGKNTGELKEKPKGL
ncbi:hypothetical protein [Myroides injenensis]|uniref:hypothetical protein n=1 Tax=Myroides injenensis TaxID=1183151 RepID=UPI000287F0EC|nr:hypothetical protein [Myroides injenensis]